MSSWVSHLPEEMAFSRVVGHGMDAAEAGALPGRGFARLTHRSAGCAYSMLHFILLQLEMKIPTFMGCGCS